MWILLIILIVVVLFGMGAGYLYNRNVQKKIAGGELKEAPPVITVDSECCGQHAVCEKESLLAAVSKKIEYYDDEELDRKNWTVLRGIRQIRIRMKKLRSSVIFSTPCRRQMWLGGAGAFNYEASNFQMK